MKILVFAVAWAGLSCLALGCGETDSRQTPVDPQAGNDADEPTETGDEPEPASPVQESAPAKPFEPAASDDDSEPAASEPVATDSHPLGDDADIYTWSTDKFTVEAGQERYLCFANTLTEDLVIDGYASRGERFVHHLIFSRASAPEPDGFAECDVAFKSSWQQLFITGAGDTALEFPEDAGHVLPAGTQLVVQMHLLNVAETPLEGAVNIDMRRSTSSNPRPVSSFIFGTAGVDLPPMERTTVVGTCAPFRNVELIAAFPHMHLMGSSMVFEVGPSADALEEVFRRDPFDFDNQIIEPLDLMIGAGTTTRVSCTFDNTTDQRVTYGESTRDEMCYLVGFAVGGGGACLERFPPNIFGR